MKIRFKATGLIMLDGIQTYVQQKMDMLEKYLGDIQVLNCDVELAVETHHRKGKIYRAEVNLELPGKLLRVEKNEKNLNKAIDKVKDHLVVMIKKYKETKKN
ncbi:ribosome-associated translation inhibitor RaiA [Candidatus Parcubacteria bacterium]|nr:MAG: ribosome-associated translation inhibitor RaiA [Candidatus Parcubacteria bacterium]